MPLGQPFDYAALYRVVAENSPDAIVTIDEASNILSVNPAAERLFGYPAPDLVGQPLARVTPERFRAGHDAGIARYLATGTRNIPWSGYRIPVLTRDGREVMTEISFGEFTVAGRRIFSGILRDLTDRMAAEDSLRQANELLQDQATELEQQTEEAQVLAEELEQANEGLHVALRRAEFLAAAAEALGASLDYAETITSVVRAAVPGLGDWCAVDIVVDPLDDAWPPAVERLAIHHQDPAKLALARELETRYPRDWSTDTGLVGVLRTGAPLFVPDVPDAMLRHAARDAEHLELLRSLHFSSIIVVPLVAGGVRLGALTLAATESGRRYQHEDLVMAQEIAAKAAAAINHARLYADALASRARAEGAADRARALQAATAALARATTEDEVADAILTEGLRALQAQDGVLCLVTSDGTQLQIVSQVGLNARTVDEFATFPIDAPLPLSEAVRTGEPVLLADKAAVVRRFPGLRDANAKAETEAWASVPLEAAGQPIGGMAWGFTERRNFADDDKVFLQTLADQCAQALERVRLLSAERAARDAAEEANRAKATFLATMSHELRTPLNAITGHGQLLELGVHGPTTDAQREAIGRIQRSAGHLLGLINDVLNYARIEASQVAYRIEAVSVRDVLGGLEGLVSPQLLAKRLRYACEPCDPAVAVNADRDKLHQVMLNLLSNAIKFTPEGGTIAVQCEPGDECVAIAVTDTGVGIPAERLEDVFTPFVQVNRSLTSVHEGAGLGLAISRDLARGMGGEVTAESVVDEGSTFRLSLPRAR